MNFKDMLPSGFILDGKYEAVFSKLEKVADDKIRFYFTVNGTEKYIDRLNKAKNVTRRIDGTVVEIKNEAVSFATAIANATKSESPVGQKLAVLIVGGFIQGVMPLESISEENEEVVY